MVTGNRVRSNIAANLAGRSISTFLAILFTPIYIKLLGIDAYGLVGFYITLQAALAFLELGLGRSCTRELARLSGRVGNRQYILDTLRSMEYVYWIFSILIGFALSFSSDWIGHHWLSSKKFTPSDLGAIIGMMGWVVALRWPIGLYVGALTGLQRQVPLYGLNIFLAILSWGGACIVLLEVSATIQAFFLWQLFVALASVVSYFFLAWHYMPGSPLSGRFSLDLWKRILPFSSGVAVNAILGTVLMQSDKLILSAVFPLKEFAYYSLASMMANAITMLATPVSSAVFPKISQMISMSQPGDKISGFYHLSCQAVSFITFPVALLFVFFPYEILLLYTGSSDIAANAAMILSVLMIAKTMHASMLVPYALQLAYGWVRFSVYVNIITVLLYIPIILILVHVYGLLGGALAWLCVVGGYVFIASPLMHKILLPGEWWSWFCRDILVTAVMVSLVLALFKMLLVFPVNTFWQIVFLICAGIISYVIAILVNTRVRVWIHGFYSGKYA